MDPIQVTALGLMLLGTLLPVLCIIKMRRVKKFKQKAVATTALITNAERRLGYKSSYYYVLSLKYSTIDTGELFTGQSITNKKYTTGEFIPVMYLADDPANYKTDFGKHLPYVLIFSLVFFGLISWFCYWLLHLEYTVRPE